MALKSGFMTFTLDLKQGLHAQNADKGDGVGWRGGEGCGNCIFFKTATRLGCAAFCRRFYPNLQGAVGWFYENLFSLPSRRQPCMSLGAGSRAPAAARSATSAQWDASHLRARGRSAPAPRKCGQVKHCQASGSRVWRRRAARGINYIRIHQFIS